MLISRFLKLSFRTLDSYSILGLQKNCSYEELRSAYVKLASKYHPDKNPNDPMAKERFILVQDAYTDLMKGHQEPKDFYNKHSKYNKRNVGAAVYRDPNTKIEYVYHHKILPSQVVTKPPEKPKTLEEEIYSTIAKILGCVGIFMLFSYFLANKKFTHYMDEFLVQYGYKEKPEVSEAKQLIFDNPSKEFEINEMYKAKSRQELEDERKNEDLEIERILKQYRR